MTIFLDRTAEEATTTTDCCRIPCEHASRHYSAERKREESREGREGGTGGERPSQLLGKLISVEATATMKLHSMKRGYCTLLPTSQDRPEHDELIFEKSMRRVESHGDKTGLRLSFVDFNLEVLSILPSLYAKNSPNPLATMKWVLRSAVLRVGAYGRRGSLYSS